MTPATTAEVFALREESSRLSPKYRPGDRLINQFGTTVLIKEAYPFPLPSGMDAGEWTRHYYSLEIIAGPMEGTVMLYDRMLLENCDTYSGTETEGFKLDEKYPWTLL